MINEHSTNQGTQTNSFKSDKAPMQAIEDETFFEYPCHYCRKVILSPDDLEEHKPRR